MISGIISEIAKKLIEADAGKSTISVRKNDLWAYKRADDNVFALASTLFLLKQNSFFFTKEQMLVFKEIEKNILSKFHLYQNKDGLETFNFYRTKPSKHFPNGIFMGRFDHFRLPDDIDDTALVYLSAENTKEQTLWLKKQCKTHEDKLNGVEIYNTWFGKNMPKEQDVCALLNLLYLFFNHDLPLESIDKNTLEYLAKSVDLILTQPFRISRHYANSTLIIYHYARFMSDFSHPLLNSKKSQLICLALDLIKKEKVFMNKILLETSLKKFGEKREKMNIETNKNQDFYSFIGAPFAPFDNPAARILADKKWAQIFWKSEIHELALLLEYLILFEKK
ncbi:hypothetical protein EGI22_12990 [Lacihabitans sp. LS3-19]|uniref:hypothetical protein n=1 Tax=Lacihabitans sp. LS3-19 TaxID=2487335 RepID=UPI0020CCEC72|nr:hypothetical protein [Lacihabitans sp. LS3-19]MCP9768835.1 hypothetical protein [Lacihabitans sp. LS3-19]